MIEKLESQICVLQAAPIIEETKTGHTTINYISLEDEETYNKPIHKSLIEKLNIENNDAKTSGVEKFNKNSSTIYVKEFTTTINDEEHNGSFYLSFSDKWGDESKEEERIGGILPFSMAMCLRSAMENAVSNIGVKKFVSLKNEDLIKPCEKYTNWANTNPQEIPRELLNIFNQHINYTNINVIDKNFSTD